MKTLRDWYIGNRLTIRFNLQHFSVGLYIGPYFWIELPFIQFCVDLSRDPDKYTDDTLYYFRQIAERYGLDISSSEDKLREYEQTNP